MNFRNIIPFRSKTVNSSGVPWVSDDCTYQGGRFSIDVPNLAFLQRIQAWLEYVGIRQAMVDAKMGFEDLDLIQRSVVETPEVLRNFTTTAGNGVYVYGEAYGKDGKAVVQPANAAVLLHERFHLAEGTPKPIEEAVAVALGIVACGCEKDIMNVIFGNREAYERSFEGVALLNQAAFSTGSKMFNLIKTLSQIHRGDPDALTYPKMLEEVDKFVVRQEQVFNKSSLGATDYLTRYHRLTEPVANIATEEFELDRETVFRNNCTMLREYISAFKALTAFYHINLQMPLPEAFKKTEEHFKRGEALGISSTLFKGAQKAFSLLKEANVPDKIAIEIVEMMTTGGPEYAEVAGKQIPALIRIASAYGEVGKKIMQIFFNTPNLLMKVVWGKMCTAIEEMTNSVHRDLVLPFIKQLGQYEWDDVRLDQVNDICNVDSITASPCFALKKNFLVGLERNDKVKMLGLATHLTLNDLSNLGSLYDWKKWGRVEVYISGTLRELVWCDAPGRSHGNILRIAREYQGRIKKPGDEQKG